MLFHLVLVFLFVPLHVVLCNVRGQLLLRVACYRHPSNMRVTKVGVTSCDTSGDCDPRFRMCLSSKPSPLYSCELGRLPLFSFKDSTTLGECAKPPPPENFPPVIKIDINANASQLYLTVDLDDLDVSFLASTRYEIDRLRFDLFPSLTAVPNNQTPTDSNYSVLNISTRSFHGNQQPYLRLLGLLQCAPNRYGTRCESFCQPTIHYTCDAHGSRVCKPGRRGKKCDLNDACVSGPCKSWATCRPVDVSSFECECDGRIGQQCVVGTDPCFNHRCLNGATCVGIRTRPFCNCEPGWTGKFCDLRVPCSPNPCLPNGNCEPKAINNGTDIKAVCRCFVGYSGPFCNVPLTTTTQPGNITQKLPTPMSHSTKRSFIEESPSVIIMFSALSGFVIVGIICIVAVCLFRRRRERKEHFRLSKAPMLEQRCTNHHPVHRDPANIYDEPGRIYSIEEDSDDEREDSDPYMQRGNLLLVPHEPRINGPPALPQRQISNNSNHSTSPPTRPVRFVRA